MRTFLVPLLLILAASSGTADTSGPGSMADRLWKDEAGRIIKRLDRRGVFTLFTYDDRGRVVEMSELGPRRASKGSNTPGLPAPRWVHRFGYDGDRLSEEVDCRGVSHHLARGAKVDPKRGSALSNHVHPFASAPSGRAGTGSRFEYDAKGRVQDLKRND